MPLEVNNLRMSYKMRPVILGMRPATSSLGMRPSVC